MLYWGLMLLRSRLFYCLQLPIHPILEGGDPNAILGVIKVMGVNAASQQTLFIVSGSSSNLILWEVTQILCWGHNSPGG